MTKQFDSRYFNNVWLDKKENKVVKFSSNIPKLEQEFLYYMSLPDDPHIREYFPRVLSFSKHSTYAILETQYIDADPLSEFLLSYVSNNRIKFWDTVFMMLSSTRYRWDKHTKINNNQIQQEFYLSKTIERVKEFENHIGRYITVSPTISINGKLLLNWSELLPLVEQYIKSVTVERLHFIHGDWCFSNILCSESGSCSFIDPRGQFGPEVCYGDRMYDIAKLYHSIHGQYDYIVNDYVTSKIWYIDTPIIDFYITRLVPAHILSLFHEHFVVDKKYLTILEGLLFVSMCILHVDNLQKSHILYGRGIELLNEGLDM